MSDQQELGAQGIASDLAAARSLLDAVAIHIENVPLDRRSEAVSAWCVGQQLIHVCLVAQSIATVTNSDGTLKVADPQALSERARFYRLAKAVGK